MPTLNPQVELTTAPEGIRPETAERLARRDLDFLILHGLFAMRAKMLEELRNALPAKGEITAVTVRYALSTAWTIVMPSFSRQLVPNIGAAYAEAFVRARAGQVSQEMINALAEQYVAQMGAYFHETSSEAMLQGFNTYVNRKVPARVAYEKVTQAYGLTPRQMSELTANTAFDQKVSSGVGAAVKEKVNTYIDKSLRQRFKIFADQEAHNISQQSQQVAWNWLVGQDKLSRSAQKVWITAKDEKVCSVCGPLHGKRVDVLEKFSNGLYVPGAHVNCRCKVRLVTVPIGKADWEEKEHPRAQDGRFTFKPNEPARVTFADRPDYSALQRFLDTAQEEEIAEAEKDDRISVSLPKANVQLPTARRVSLPTASTVSLPTQEEEKVSVALPVEETKSGSLPGQTTVKLPGAKVSVKLPSDSKTVTLPTSPKEDTENKKKLHYIGVLPLDNPVYAVLDPDDGQNYSSYVNLSHMTTFYTTKEEALKKAAEARQRLIADYYNEYTSFGKHGVTLQMKDHLTGQHLVGELDEHQFNDVLRSLAGYYEVGPVDDQYFEVAFNTPDGDQAEIRRLSSTEIGEILSIEPEALMFGVAKATRFHHHPSRGMTEYNAGSKYGESEITTSGEYEISDSPDMEEMSDGMAIPIYDITPYDPYME